MSNNQRRDEIRLVAAFDDVAVSLNPAAAPDSAPFTTKSANEGIRRLGTFEVGAVSFEPAVAPGSWDPRSDPQVRIAPPPRSRRAEILGRVGGALWRGAAVAAVAAVCVQYGTLLLVVGSCLATILIHIYSDFGNTDS